MVELLIEEDLKAKGKKMKRINNVYEKIISIETLMLADEIARKDKLNQVGIIEHDKNREANILALHESLKNKTYRTPEYTTFPIREPKLRIIYRLPYIHRVLHHAIMIGIRSMFLSHFTADTYGCIIGKGINAADKAIKAALKDKASTLYCLQIDVQKFYPSIDHTILKTLLRRKIKDVDCLWLLDGIIDSAPGLPIGNYLSQYLSNFYLSPFDHWLKEVKRVRYYFRYVDDIAIFSHSKDELHQLLADIKVYLAGIKLTLKHNQRIFPMKCGLDMLGQVYFPTHTRMRKSIKQNLARRVRNNSSRSKIAGYIGWARRTNSKHLLKKLLWHTDLVTLVSKRKAKRSSVQRLALITSLTPLSQ